MQRIIFEAVPQEQQRYDTLGDWFTNADGDLVIRVTGASFDDPGVALIGLHELVEVLLCRHRGITEQAVDAHDFAFTGDGEPGDSPAAPYRGEHRFAMIVEHLMALEYGIPGYGKIE